MREAITHTTDSRAFLYDMAKTLPEWVEFDDNDKPLKLIDTFQKTYTLRVGVETMSRIKVDAATLAKLAALPSCVVLSAVAEGDDILAAMSVTHRATYDRLYPQDDLIITDMGGGTFTQAVPAEFCRFT